MTIRFTKMQGLGNDFVVIDGTSHKIHLNSSLIRAMSDRHLGIGFDQLLLIEPSTSPQVDFVYRIFNADGTEVGQCGNGARCVGKFLIESGLTEKTHLTLSTLERQLNLDLLPNGEVSVNMGVPLFDPSQVPFEASARAKSYEIKVENNLVKIAVVNVGNPHAILLVPDIEQVPVNELGPLIEHHPGFPQGVNVGFMQKLDSSHIRLRVFERGVGETLACGSGACAAVAIGRIQGFLDESVEVELRGGRLKIHWKGEGESLSMIGAAKSVFKGEWF